MVLGTRDQDASTSQLPKRTRSFSHQYASSLIPADASPLTDTDQAIRPAELPDAKPVRRSISLDTVRTVERVASTRRFRIVYRDEELCRNALENVYRLIRAARADAATGPNDASSTPSQENAVRLAKKALRYRRLLRRAQEVDLDDPAFDINAFLRVTWCKAEDTN